MQRLETGKFILWGNISSGIQDHQKNDLQPGTKLWGAAWPGRSATIHRCFKTCLVYKLFCPSITREVNSIYMRQPAITRLTESSPLSPPAHPSATCSQARCESWTQARTPADFTGLSCLPGFYLLPLKLNAWHCPGRGSLVPSHVCVVHLPPWTCLTAFLHGRGDFLFSYIPLSALISVNRLWCLLCWQRQPWQERTFNLFPRTEPWEAVSAPRHNSLGSSPKNALSSTRLLSNICLPPVRFKLATSVPLALSTCARNGVESLKKKKKSTNRLVEVVFCELFVLLWHFIAGLFPAWIKHVASSKGEAHKGKKVFRIQWDSPIESNTTSSYFCLYNYTCMLWLAY